MPVHNNKVKQVLHILASLDRGGVETWLMYVMKHIDSKKVKIDVCVIGPELEGAYSQQFKELGGKILHCFGLKRWWRRLVDRSFQKDFRTLLRENGYDIVHCHCRHACVLQCAKREHVPVRIAHIHPPRNDVYKQNAFHRVRNQYLRKKIDLYATDILAPSNGTMHSHFGDRTEDLRYKVLYNGIPLVDFEKEIDRIQFRKQLEIPVAGKIVLTVGRYVPHKNQELVVHIADELCKKRNDIFFVLNGTVQNQSYFNNIKNMVSQKQLNSRFRFIGPVDDLIPIWKAADLFLFPSKMEGFGIVIIEASAAGLPVVSSDILGIREAAKGCRHIRLIALTSPVRDWANAVEDMLECDREGSSEAIEYVRKTGFAIESSVDNLLKIYGAIST